MIFTGFYGFFGLFYIFFWFFKDFFWIFEISNFFLIFFIYFFLVFLGLLSKLLMLLLKVTKVTNGHQKLPKMGQNHNKLFFLPEAQQKALAKGRSPPQELELCPHSGPYLLVTEKGHMIVLDWYNRILGFIKTYCKNNVLIKIAWKYDSTLSSYGF